MGDGADRVVRRRRAGREAIDGIERRRPGQRAFGQRDLPHPDRRRFGCPLQPRLGRLLRGEAIRRLDGQAGIRAGQRRDLFALGGDVLLAGKEMRQPARRIEHRRNRQPVPERSAVFAVVEDVALDRPTGADRGANLGDDGAVGVGALEQAAVAADKIRRRITAKGAETVVDVDQWIVGLARIGDRDRCLRRGNDGAERIVTGMDQRGGQPVGAGCHGSCRRVGVHASC